MSNSSPLEVKIKSGTFYLSSKEEQTEKHWKKVEVTNPQTGEKLQRWHKELTIEGNLLYVGMQDDKFAGRVATLLIKGFEGETYSLKIPIMSTKGVKATDSYFNSLALVLPNLKKGDSIKMFVNSKNKDKSDNLYKNIVVLNGENKLIKGNVDFKDIPKWNAKEVVDAFGDKKTEYDPTPTNTFYIQEFMKSVNYFKELKESKEDNSGSQPSYQAPQTPKASDFDMPKNNDEDEDSGLPF